MQLQIFLTKDKAYLNVLHNGQKVSLKGVENPYILYFSLWDGHTQVSGGMTQRGYYFDNVAGFLGDEKTDTQFAGSLYNCLKNNQDFFCKREMCGAETFISCIYNEVSDYLNNNEDCDIDTVAISGFPIWTEGMMEKLSKELSLFNVPVTRVPFEKLYSACADNYIAMIGECFEMFSYDSQLGEFISKYKAPKARIDFRLHSAINSIVERVDLTDEQVLTEIDAFVDFCESERILEKTQKNGELSFEYTLRSKKGIKPVHVYLNADKLIDNNVIRFISVLAQNCYEKMGRNIKPLHIIGDFSEAPSVQEAFLSKGMNAAFYSIPQFLNKNVFIQEWTKSTGAKLQIPTPPIQSSPSTPPIQPISQSVQSQSVLNINDIRVGGTLTLITGPKMHKFERLSSSDWKIVASTGSLSAHVGTIVGFGANCYCTGEKISVTKGGSKWYNSSPLDSVEIENPVETEPQNNVGSGFEVESAASGFDVEETSTVAKGPVDVLNLMDLPVDYLVYLEGTTPGKPDSRKTLQYLGNCKFETIENNRGWSKKGESIASIDSCWNVGQEIRFVHEPTGKTAKTRTIKLIKII